MTQRQEKHERFPARRGYRRRAVATAYDRQRFCSPVGRLIDQREQHLIERGLAAAGRLDAVLDLPAGTGRLGGMLRRRAALAVGADRSPMMLRQSDRYAGRAVVSDAVELPFGDDTFDAVVSLRFMGHLPPAVRAAALAEMARVARRCLVIAFYDDTPVTRLRRFWRRLTGRVGSGVWYPEPIDRTRERLAEQGFTLLDAYPIARFVSETWVLVLAPPDAGSSAS